VWLLNVVSYLKIAPIWRVCETVTAISFGEAGLEEELKGTVSRSAAFIQSVEPVKDTAHPHDVVRYDSFPFATRSLNHLLLPGFVIIFFFYFLSSTVHFISPYPWSALKCTINSILYEVYYFVIFLFCDTVFFDTPFYRHPELISFP